MTERWQRLESLLHAALARPADERAAYLAEACGSDDELRREVASLAAGAKSIDDFLETPAAGPSLIGRQLGAYRVERLIGGGGMGEVYQAKDTRLGRNVAVKILPAAWVADAQRRTRFEREARAIAALNHPNICTIYDVGRDHGIDFLVMELLDGEPLSARLAHGPLPANLALAHAIEIADALDCAHRQGVIHRDLKPANVVLTKGQAARARVVQAKLVDFGLARFTPSALETGTMAATALASMTSTGAVIGTPQYMAPEQIEGRAADARTDIFAFGALLHEMFTGQRAFEGESMPALMAAILRADPPSLTAVQPGLAPALERLIHACLAKNPGDRVSTMHDVLLQLRGIADELRPVAVAVETDPPKTTRLRRSTTVAVLAAVLIVIGVITWQFWPSGPILAARDTIVLADFVNTTGDDVYEGALKQALAMSLEQSPFLNTLAEVRIDETLRLMQRPVGEPITRAVAQEICQRQNLKAFVAGAIAPIGTQFAISLEAVNGQTGDVLARELVQAARKEEVLAAVGTAASRMRARLGEPLASIQKYGQPLEMVTTSSLEALRVYSIGIGHFRRGQWNDAIVAYTRATEFDPAFAKAFDSLVPAYANSGREAVARDAMRRAFALRDRVSERERLLIEARYQFFLERNLPAALEHYTRYLSIYTDSATWYTTVGQIHRISGQPELAIEPLNEALRRDSSQLLAPAHLAWALISLGRVSEAKAVLETYKRDERGALRARFAIAYSGEDAAGVQEILDTVAAQPILRGSLLSWQSEVAGFEGRWNETRKITRRAEGSRLLAEGALRDAAFEACGSALVDGERALTDIPDNADALEAKATAALALSWCGDLRLSAAFVDELHRQYPNGTIENGLWIPLIRAADAIHRDPERALVLLDRMKAFERSNLAVFRPMYMRGLAYLRLERPSEAAAEFQRILDNRGLGLMSPLYPLAHVGVARAAAIAGDVARARQAYEAFFSIWKNADAEVPILVKARKEYVELAARRDSVAAR